MILSSIALVSYRNSITHAKEAALRSDLFLMRDAIDQVLRRQGQVPGVARRARVGELPADGAEGSVHGLHDTWQTTEADAPPGTVSTTSPGIFEVKSGSQFTALDGSRYADW